MNNRIWLAAGIAAMLLATPSSKAPAALNLQLNSGNRPSFVINSAPNFVFLRTQGFSVSVGSPYDIIYYGRRYYLYYNGRWYRSSHYRGPWMLVQNNGLPFQIRRYRWQDIRRYRDIEYRRSDRRTNQYQRNDDNQRRAYDQQHRAVEQRQAPVQQNRVVAPRQAPAQQNRVVAPLQAPAQQNRAIGPRQAPALRSRAVETPTVQGQQNKAAEGRKIPDQKKSDEQNNERPGGGRNRN